MTKAETTVERVGGYRVVRRLATGGTSDVLLARAEGPLGFERNVVLKRLLAQFRDDDEFTKMFAREASAYARLSHPSIVRLFDFFAVPPEGSTATGRGADGQLVMVLEHVDGPALSRFRSQLKGIGKELEYRASVHIATRVFDALASAHATLDDSGQPAPVIHRDVNPSNILLPYDGQVKLADFGVAKVTGLEHKSVAGMIKGTYGYMAPEQVTGDPVTPRADVYACGIVLWELLTKRRAFQRGALPEMEALRAMAEPRLVSIDQLRPDIDKAVRDALKRALEPRADRRTITAEEMVSVLTSIVRPDEGREQLAAALSLVRTASLGTEVTDASGRGDVEPVAPTPAPNPAVAVPPPPLSPKPKGMPPPPRVTMAFGSQSVPLRVSRPAMAKVVPPAASASGTLPATKNPSDARPPPLPPDLPKHPSIPKLFAAMTPATPGRGPEVGPHRTTSAAKRLASTVKIDEVLRDVPSSMPPSILDDVASSGYRIDVIPPMGAIPASPAPMTSSADALAPTLPPAEALAETSPPGPNVGAAVAAPIPTTLVMSPITDASPPTPRMAQPGQRTQVMESITMDTIRGPSQSPPATTERARPDHPTPSSPAPTTGELGASSSSPPAGLETTQALSSRRRTLVGLVVAILMLVACIGIIGAIAYQRYEVARARKVVPSPVPVVLPTPAVLAAPTATESATPAPSAPAVTATASVGAAVPEPVTQSAAPAAPAVPSPPTPAPAEPLGEGMGVVKTAGATAGRRIFVDDKTLGQTPESVTVKCGKHTVRIGSSGKSQAVDVPCGGELSVSDKL